MHQCPELVTTYNTFFGLITKHHLVQIAPVAIKATFCVIESFSAGRRKSLAPASTTPHFITGALVGLSVESTRHRDLLVGD